MGRRLSVKGWRDWGKGNGRELAERGRDVYQRAGGKPPEGRKRLSGSPDGPESVALNNRVVNSPRPGRGPKGGEEGSSPARGRSGLELVNGIESRAIADTGRWHPSRHPQL